MKRDVRTWKDLKEATDFIKNFVITNDYKKTSQMAYMMCRLSRVVMRENDKKCHLDLGVYGKDAPWKLIKEVIQNLKTNYPQTDVIIINGDFNAHGVSVKHDITDEKIQESWKKMKKLMAASM